MHMHGTTADEGSTLQHYAVKTLENLYTRMDLETDLGTDSLAQPSIAGKIDQPKQSLRTSLRCLLKLITSLLGDVAAGPTSRWAAGVHSNLYWHEISFRAKSAACTACCEMGLRCHNTLCSHADALLEVWMSAQQEPLRTCAASALCRMLRCYPGLAGPATSRPSFVQQVGNRLRPSGKFPSLIRRSCTSSSLSCTLTMAMHSV